MLIYSSEDGLNVAKTRNNIIMQQILLLTNDKQRTASVFLYLSCGGFYDEKIDIYCKQYFIVMQ